MSATTTEERLAALRARRAPHQADSDTAPGSTGQPTEPLARPPRRRSPAAASKILAAGASTTAVLGIVTVMGVADRAESQSMPDPTLPPAAPPLPPATVPAPDSLIVVVLDAAGAALGTSVVDPRAGDTAVVTLDFLATAPPPTAPMTEAPAATVPSSVPPAPPEADLGPVAAPNVVDLAVPVPPPRPAPAPTPRATAAPQAAPAPQPAPQPEATSSGS